MQADNIARAGFFHQHPLARLEGYGVRNFDIFASTRMPHFHAFTVFSRAHSHKGNTVSMLGIHIGLNFKDKA